MRNPASESEQKRFGWPQPQWDAAREEIRTVLIHCARADQLITYSALVEQVRAIRLDPHSSALANMLGEISKDEIERGRGMLSVLVVHKDGDLMPGDGFFQLASQLSRDISDREACWVRELNLVHKMNR